MSFIKLDLRSLALFRVSLALILIVDLLIRLQDTLAHYTDFGLLPRTAWQSMVVPERLWSLHSLSGSVYWQYFLIGIALTLAVSLLLGQFTRLSSIGSWILLLSIQNRNPFILQGGDVFLRILLLYACLLPIGELYSLDSLRRRLNTPSIRAFVPVSTSVSLCLTLQVVFVYWFSYLLKSGPDWRINDYAVQRVLGSFTFATKLGQSLSHHQALVASLCPLILAIEGFAPFLLFVPGKFSSPCRSGAVLLFIFLHLAFALCLNLGPFPWVCITAWILFIPSQAWDLVIKPPLVTFKKQRHGPAILGFIFFAYGLGWNLESIGYTSIMPGHQKIAVTLGIDQKWNMFAPGPPRDDAWIVGAGQFSDARVLNALNLNQSSINWDKPTNPYSSERWRKFFSEFRNDDRTEVRAEYAKYICRLWNHTSAAISDDSPSTPKTDRSLKLVDLDFYAMIVSTGAVASSVQKKHLLHEKCL